MVDGRPGIEPVPEAFVDIGSGDADGAEAVGAPGPPPHDDPRTAVQGSSDASDEGAPA